MMYTNGIRFTGRLMTLVRRWAACLVLGAVLSGGVQAAVPSAPAEPEPTVTAVNLSGGSLQGASMTFGQPFRAGDIPAGETVAAYLDGQALPTQVDAKATNPDGSLRHAVLTVQLPALSGHASRKLALRPVSAATASGKAVALADVLNSGFDAGIDVDINGTHWKLDARKLLKTAQAYSTCKPYGKKCATWLSGPLVSAWVVGGPLVNAAGTAHPHLAVYFAVRAYGPAPVKRVRVDVIVENDWAYAPDPQNVTYDATINVAGKKVYSVKDLKHYRQARWHKVFWWGDGGHVYARLDPDYLQATLAVPNYPDVPAPDAWLADQRQACAPMKHCDQTAHMGSTGAQAAIGPLPRWTSVYVIKPTHHAFNWMLANTDALGSYPVHYRDQQTGSWVSVENHPCMTTIWHRPPKECPVAPHGNDRLPKCPKSADCKVPWKANIAHVPAAAYVAYMVTGDWYYLTEMSNWANWEFWGQNQAYRGYTKGYVHRIAQRAQAWGLRTLGDAAYILPDDDPFKKLLNDAIANNLAWYNKHYTENPDANNLHIVLQHSIVYGNDGDRRTGIATWQNSFFVWSVGNLKNLGFAGADKFLAWVAKFPVGLMTSPDYCWTLASWYELRVRDTRTSPIYPSLAEVYRKNFPELKGVACNSASMREYMDKHRSGGHKFTKNEMSGYPSSPTGFVANFQIGLAAATETKLPHAEKAWSIFANRANQPDYSKEPQFDVIPRRPHE